MCTLTWQVLPGGYELHFNRDERRTRAKAELPKIQSVSDIKTIAPKDPEAHGTWISVNQSGVALCLLNNYKEIKRTSGLISRGQLVSSLAHSKNQSEAQLLFRTLDITAYNPFDLFVFSPDNGPYRYRWDGESLDEIQPSESFMSSSGFDTNKVIQSRRDQYFSTDKTNLDDYHRSHEPSRSAYSVCMHRSDAGTQSYSKIRVDANACSFWYTDGPPCTEPLQEPLVIERLSH